MQDLISVIVPIYKVEKYLKKCVDGIINQTYRNLEIFLVDDGSPDNCGSICDEYAQRDSRIHVIHKQNGGLSDARNVALDVINGKYVTFIDSDDYIAEDYIEYLYKLIFENQADISICEFNYVTEDGKIINHPLNNKKIKCMNQEEALYELFKSKLYSNSASGKLYKCSIFSNIRYPKGKIYEDVATTYKTFLKSEKIVFGAKTLYFYLYRYGSISKQKFNINRLMAVEFAEYMVKDVVSIYPKLIEIGKCRLFDSYWAILKDVDYNENYDVFVLNLSKLRTLRKDILKCREATFKRKIKAILTMLPNKLFVKSIERF